MAKTYENIFKMWKRWITGIVTCLLGGVALWLSTRKPKRTCPLPPYIRDDVLVFKDGKLIKFTRED